MRAKEILAVMAGFFLLVGATWVIQGNDFFLYRMFAPKYEGVRREVFEQSKAFNQGMIQELQNMQFQYLKMDKGEQDGKDAVAAIILHRAADYDETKLPPDLRSFIQQLRRERALSK